MRGSEHEQIDELVELNLTTLPHSPLPVQRRQHPKHHGCVSATFRVCDDLPPGLRSGVFAEPRSFRTLVRFSNGRAFDDREADAHGMAIKLLGVEGDWLIEGAEEAGAQDFILVDSETFFTGDPEDYARVNRAIMGSGWTRLCGWLGLLLRPGLLMRMRRFVAKLPNSPLGSGYFSTVPYRLGGSVVKYAALPRDPVEVPVISTADGLSEVLRRRLAQGPFTFAFVVDVQSDASRHPIEDPTVCWSAEGAERVQLAELVLDQQEVDASAPLAENLQFSPWHGLTQHEPLGYINRARLPIYRTLAAARHERNGVNPLESAGAPDGFYLPRPANSEQRSG